MTKADLVEEVTQLGDLTRRDGEMIVDTIFDSVIHALRSGDKIEIRGFGSFRIRQRKPRTGRNPKAEVVSNPRADGTCYCRYPRSRRRCWNSAAGRRA